MRSLLHDQRGALMLEAFIAALPVLLLFVLLCQTSDLYVHQLIVQRAANAAARAAVVVLPDDGRRYGDPDNSLVDRYAGGRKHAVEQAARSVLRASPSLSASAATLELTGPFEPHTAAEARLSTEYTCLLGRVPLICGRGGKLRLSARARLTYQGAHYLYEREG